MIDPLSPETQLEIPLKMPDWLVNHALACPEFFIWMQPFIEDEE